MMVAHKITRTGDGMFCMKCGTQLPNEGMFCPNCGTKNEVPEPALIPSQPPQPAPVYAAPPVEVPKKRSMKPLIIVLAVVLLVVLGIGGFVGFNAFQESQRAAAYDNAVALMDAGEYDAALTELEGIVDYKDASSLIALCGQNLDYNTAVALMNSGDYEGAKNTFEGLSSFKDSRELAEDCGDHIQFAEAQSQFESGAYDKALALFTTLANKEFPKAGDWVNKTLYAQAGEKFDSGDLYGAYQGFVDLGSYEDSAERATACTTPMPGNGELYHNDGFVSSSVHIIFDAANTSAPHYLKIYSGDTLVSAIFINGNGSATIQVPAGTYTVKSASGSVWFGEETLFGDDGTYYKMMFEGEGEASMFQENYEYTITLYSVVGGNVAHESVDPGSF